MPKKKTKTEKPIPFRLVKQSGPYPTINHFVADIEKMYDNLMDGFGKSKVNWVVVVPPDFQFDVETVTVPKFNKSFLVVRDPRIAPAEVRMIIESEYSRFFPCFDPGMGMGGKIPVESELPEGTRGTPGNTGQYTGAVQPIDLIRAQGLNFCEGSVVKYVCRWRKKGGVLDLEKARQYLDWLIEDAKKESVDKLN